ncbi:CHAP domain-containing protein [Weissella diestrammenae]|uniref:CHAP domain-containing protein n=1 Tax=Weissella diestrammenae TaxID=1162633 RepID=A0A7G9T3Q3_9LACO|nr:phage tail tip lysozyme [Weissella diestrammenae]MCM0582710.1 CHAP domain-containing protein [Weissella diestrammenae]QNN74728.1 CHAP domain-containing protein [Weissella diestrammenae]
MKIFRNLKISLITFISLLLVVIVALMGISSNSSCDTDTSVSVVNSADQKQTALSLASSLKKVDSATDAGISAYLGNTEAESGISSTRIESDATYDEAKALNLSLSGYAFGFNQWDKSRRVDLINYAKSQNKSWTDASLQLDFALNHDGANSDLLKQGLQMGDVSEATEFLRAKWERGGVGTTDKRISLAKKWYTLIASGASDNVAVDVASDNNAESKNEQSETENDVGCSTNTVSGMGSSGASVLEIPANYKNKVTDTNFTATSSTNTYPINQCTWYAYNRMQALGTPVDNAMGNGGDWGASAKTKGYQTSNKPQKGWAVSFGRGVAGADPTYGHVAVVEAVSDDGSKFLISECNAVKPGTGTISFREITLGSGMTFIQGKK